MKILLAEDDPKVASFITNGLSENGHSVDHVTDGREALTYCLYNSCDLAILDRMMPGMDGLSVVRALRAARNQTPVLFLTALADVSDRVEGLAAGADDYLVKPFEPKELLLRINAILRRMPAQTANGAVPKVLHLGQVRYDIDRGELWQGNELVRLTSTEAGLMRVFAAQPGVALSRDRLVGDLPREEGGGQERAVDVQITRLRRKIEADPKQPRYLQTVRGEGYMLQPD